MGVRGLNILLKSIKPSIFKEIPNRLRGIQGKKIVFDGNLITQGFYYSNHQSRNYHIQRWYQLAQTLEKWRISAICVFDGEERHVAKAKETKRRQELRRVIGVRWSSEKARLQRFKELRKAVYLFQSLDTIDKQRVLDALNDLSFTDSETIALLQKELMTTEPVTPTELPTSSLKGQVEGITAEGTPRASPDDVISIFRSLSIKYKAELSKLLSRVTSTDEDQPQSPDATKKEEQVDKSMSKRQAELAVQEGKLWKEIVDSVKSPTGTSDIAKAVKRDLSGLVKQSREMAKSLDRRRLAPPPRIYQESQKILRAMGIPCIQTTDGIEAEALASSIVLAGQADFVAGEDSDVMVYEVNLLRNITARGEPLISVSGKDMRTALGLTSEQFVDFALLLGTDFTDRILDIGPKTALRFIKKHGTIEAIVEHIKHIPKHKPSGFVSWDAYFAQIKVARSMFKNPPRVPFEDIQPIPKDEALTSRILRRYGLSSKDYSNSSVARNQLIGQNYFKDNPSTIAET